MTEQSSTLPSSAGETVIPEDASISSTPISTKQVSTVPEGEIYQDKHSPNDSVSNATVTENPISDIPPADVPSSNEGIEKPPIPIEAPQSTIPEVVETVDDIYDFDGLSGRNTTLL